MKKTTLAFLLGIALTGITAIASGYLISDFSGTLDSDGSPYGPIYEEGGKLYIQRLSDGQRAFLVGINENDYSIVNIKNN